MGSDPLTTPDLLDILQEIYRHPKRLQSNFIRDHAYEVGRLASLGLITTRYLDAFGHHWRVTFTGLRVIELGEIE